MMSQDLFVEVSHGPTLIDNNILLSDASLRLATQGVALVHNLICGSFTAVGAGTDSVVEGVNHARYTPYHIPHRTEVMGFMTILHGDDRFYNNIFVQKWPAEPFLILRDSEEGCDEENREVGAHVLDDYPTFEEWIRQFDMDTDIPDMKKLEPAHFRHLPVWADGNAYFAGAKPWKNEKNYLLDADHDIKVELISQDGAPCLSTNLYDYLNGFSAEMIHSDTLGCAFEPEQRLRIRTAPPSPLTETTLAATRVLRFCQARSPARKTPKSRCGRDIPYSNLAKTDRWKRSGLFIKIV